MERDERLLPLPNIGDLQPGIQDPEYPAKYPASYDNLGDDKRSIQEYLHVVYKRLPLILALTILVTAASAFYMYRLPSIYRASTSLIIEPKKQKLTQVSINLGNDFKYYNTQLKLLRNRDLMHNVVLDTGLYKNPNLFNNQNKGIIATAKSIFSGRAAKSEENDSLSIVTDDIDGENPEVSSLTPDEKRRAEMYSGRLLGGITVTQEPKTNIVNISVTNHNPRLAAILANGIAETFIKQDSERETRRAKGLNRELKKSIGELKDVIATQEQQLIGAMRSSNIALTGERGNGITANKLSTLSSQWLAAMDERRKAEANYNAARNSKNLGVLPSEIIGETMRDEQKKYLEEKSKLEDVLREYDKQINDAEVKLKELLVKYTKEYSEVKKAEATISSLKETRENTELRYIKRINSEKAKGEKEAKSLVYSGLSAKLKAAKNRENQLLNEYLRETSAANVRGQAERQMTTLRREIETKRRLLDTYIQRQKEQELTITSSLPDNIKVSAKAITPGGPMGPERNRNIIVAFLASLFGGIGLAFLLDYLDDSIRTSDDVSRNLGLPTLALIPHQDAIKKQLGAGSDVDNGSKVHSLALIALKDRRSAVAEAYRHLRTSLLFSSAGKPPQAILVTSSQPSEGKTTTAINTAITLAQADANVVIIDCDLRRPRLHNHFGMTNSNGLTNYLSGDKNTTNLLKTCPDLKNLKIISSGPIPPNPAELLSSNEMKNLLQNLKGNFDHIVLDSPPAISFTDSAILSTLVDGVVLVAMAGSSSMHLMKRFKQRLAGLGTRIYGVVINGVKPNSLEYGYYGYNYSYDYYANSDETTPLLEDEPKELLDNVSEENEASDTPDTKS